MLDFTDKTPYEILNVSETAITPVIERQLRHKLSLYCALDRNATDINGNNLREIFEQAAQTLTDPIKRKKLDQKIAQERQLINIINKYSIQAQPDETQPKYIVLRPDGTLYSSNERSLEENEITVPIHKTTIQPKTNIDDLIKQINLSIINDPTILSNIYQEEGKKLTKK